MKRILLLTSAVFLATLNYGQMDTSALKHTKAAVAIGVLEGLHPLRYVLPVNNEVT